ncbi:helix-turn-helix transcriptional regulator [Listeria aquatica]|uniref:Helix-turn-helix transcriptional regulator n=1 Tax=Listeria aquatica TaxID=1494960 RepID=A0A841ZK64_9LIST|nr:helix-turn-helix transcriptional regulator [Listeria aquatica]
MILIQLSERQHAIMAFVKKNEPATGDQIARFLKLTRATIRSDLAVLTMTGILDARPKVGYFYSGLEKNPGLFEDIRNLKVSEVMTHPILVPKEMSVYDAIVQLFLEDSGSLYVAEEARLIGLVSRKDLLKSTIAGSNTKETPIVTIMTRMPNLLTIKKTDPVLDAALSIVTHQVDSLPVVEAEDRIIGKLSKSSIVELFVTTLKEEN